MSRLKAQHLQLLPYVVFIGLLLSTVYWAYSSWTPSLHVEINSWVLPFYFVTSAVMFFIIMSDDLASGIGNKIGIVFGHSFLTRVISIILIYPGMSGDNWYHLGHSRTWLDTGLYYFSFLPAPIRVLTPEIQSTIGRIYTWHRAGAQHSLVVVLARMLSIDVYLVHLCLLGVLWSLFIPAIAIKTAKVLGASNRASLLAGVLMASAPVLMTWSFIEVPNSLGYLFFAVTVYFCAKLLTSDCRRKYTLLAFAASIVSVLAHNMTGVVSIGVFWLALTLARCYSFKNRRRALPLLSLGLAISIMLLPAATVGMQLIYPIKSSLSLQKFLELNLYEIILTNFSAYTFIEGVTLGALSFLAVCGIALKARDRKGRGVLIFLTLTFAVLIAQYRVFYYFIDPPPFGVHRILIFVPFAITPLAALAINRLFKWLTMTVRTPAQKQKNPSSRIRRSSFTLQQLLAVLLVCISLSMFLTQAISESWDYISGRGNISIVSAYSIEAAKLLHEEYLRTSEKYVVVSDQLTEMAGIGLVGRYNPNEYFMISIGGHQNKILYKQVIGDISVEPMFTAATYNGATLTYLVASRWSARWYLGASADYEAIVYELGKQFEPVTVLGSGDGQIHIFRYRVPYKALEGSGPAVTVFMDSQENQLNTTYSYLMRREVTYTLSLTGATTYSITSWPLAWSYQSIYPSPQEQTIDANTWVNLTAQSSDISYNVTWIANDIYPNAFWKDDSFMEGWYVSGGGKATHTFSSDGDIGTITVEGESRDYVIYEKQVLPYQNDTLSLLARLIVVEDTILYITVYDDTVDPRSYIFFSYGVKTQADYTTILYPLPENSTITRVRLTVRTPDGSPSSVNLDYLMLVQT